MGSDRSDIDVIREALDGWPERNRTVMAVERLSASLAEKDAQIERLTALREWSAHVHPDGDYVSIRHRDAIGDTLLRLTALGWRDREAAHRFFAAVRAALGVTDDD